MEIKYIFIAVKLDSDCYITPIMIKYLIWICFFKKRCRLKKVNID